MSRREIEDVLSSIRRLVAQDPPRQEQSPPEGDAEGASGKLILTSELRVADGLVQTATESPAAVDAEPEAPEEMPAAAHQATDAPEKVETPSAIHMLRAMNQRVSDHRAGGMQKTAAAQTDADTIPARAQSGTDDDRDLALEATLARLEQALSQPTPQTGPDTAAQDPLPGADEAAQDAPRHQQIAPSPDEPVIDEAMLYQIVANIVRQELQGELGERITRNIRKLVRAEVARELQLRKS
ncbi:hypothetical protein [Roseinatronobacter sp.]